MPIDVELRIIPSNEIARKFFATCHERQATGDESTRYLADREETRAVATMLLVGNPVAWAGFFDGIKAVFDEVRDEISNSHAANVAQAMTERQNEVKGRKSSTSAA